MSTFQKIFILTVIISASLDSITCIGQAEYFLHERRDDDFLYEKLYIDGPIEDYNNVDVITALSNSNEPDKDGHWEYIKVILEYDGYVVKKNTDTIYGKLLLLSSIGCHRRVIMDYNSDKKNFYPEDLICYMINDESFVTIDNHNFVRLLKEGPISLYECYMIGSAKEVIDDLKTSLKVNKSWDNKETFRYYLKKNDSGINCIGMTDFEDQIIPFIADNLELTQKVKNETYNYSIISKIIDQYNSQSHFLNNTLFLNGKYEYCDKDEALYSRHISCDTLCEFYKVKTYKLSGELIENKKYISRVSLEIADALNGRKEALTIDSVYLKEIPPELFKLKDLRELTITNSLIREIPVGITGLINLKKLNLSHNRIDYIFKEIVNMQNLEEIDLSYNFLNDIPDELFMMRNLIKLNISFNDISKLPSTIWDLINLETLSIMSTKIKKIPKEITNLKKLKYTNILWNERLSASQQRKFKMLMPNVKDIE